MEYEEVSEALDDISLQVSEWQDETVAELEQVLNDMSELEDQPVEGEAVILAGKLFLQVTGGDWKQAEGLAAVLHSYFTENRSNRGELIHE